MKTLILLTTLVLAPLAHAYEQGYLPAVQIVELEAIDRVDTYMPDVMRVKFQASACRTLHPRQFQGQIENGRLSLRLIDTVDCFGPARVQTLELFIRFDSYESRSIKLENSLLIGRKGWSF